MSTNGCEAVRHFRDTGICGLGKQRETGLRMQRHTPASLDAGRRQIGRNMQKMQNHVSALGAVWQRHRDLRFLRILLSFS